MGNKMQVVILCGGLGTRLREETEFRPKPMVAIGGRPILWHIMKIYAQQGYREFVLSLGYKGEMIKEYFSHYELMNNDVTLELGHPERVVIHQSHQEKDWKVTLADTGEKTLKGARLKRVERYIHGPEFMMTYGDGLADIDLRALLKFHHQHGKMATVSGIIPPSRFGELSMDGEQAVAFNEKPRAGGRYVNGGFFVFRREVFDHLSADEGCDLEVGPLEKLAREGQLMVYRHHGEWASMDTMRDVEHLNRLWNEKRAFWKTWQ